MEHSLTSRAGIYTSLGSWDLVGVPSPGKSELEPEGRVRKKEGNGDAS